ncbi:unnamed protein product [Strongylus vulgaris]|uniref:Peptidase M13 C-terminal domain-containing protein n=1 Tax=Strongylus vulgaris TaxID=40348 RepID=A0A3P7HWV8_STRVU|nr:unnamed protein product [Strongylus vulgaris]
MLFIWFRHLCKSAYLEVSYVTDFRALNYAGIGATIGHEITHGFDDRGRQFDATGNLREWWDEEVKKKFEERAQCMIKQYAKIEFQQKLQIKVPGTGLNINGKLTLGENIADNGGVKSAYRAYRAYLRRRGGEEKRVKGLEHYSNEQMFFLGYAMSWCGHATSDKLINFILTNVHAPERYRFVRLAKLFQTFKPLFRVNQVLANQPEFAAAFKCKVGSAMNPIERCAVW